MHILIYYKFTLLKGIHFYVPKTENIYVVIYSFLIFISTKYAGNAEWDFKITTYFPKENMIYKLYKRKLSTSYTILCVSGRVMVSYKEEQIISHQHTKF